MILVTCHRDKINKKRKNVVISAEYIQPAGDFKQYKTYLENSLIK